MASYDDAIIVPPKPDGMSWPQHVLLQISKRPIERDLMGEENKPALRFSRDDFDDMVRSLEPYTVKIHTDQPYANTMFGHPVIVEPPKETHG